MKKMSKFLGLCVVVVLLLMLTVGSVCAYAAWENAYTLCPNYSFESINHATVSNSTDAENAKVIIFFRNNCPNSQATISSVAEADWVSSDGLSLFAVNLDGADLDSVGAFADTYGNGGEDITFCTDTSGKLWSFLRAAGYSTNDVSLPVSFIIDANGYIRHYMAGYADKDAFQRPLSNYVEEIDDIPLHNVSVTGTFDYDEAYAVLEEVNAQRKLEGLDALVMNEDLLCAAMQRAAECSLYYSHTRPNGENPYSVLGSKKGSSHGENIAAGYYTAADVMDGWMNSPGHRANILYEDFDSIGVGCFYQEGARYWVQMFAGNYPTNIPVERSKETAAATVSILENNLDLRLLVTDIQLKAGMQEELDVYHQNPTLSEYGTYHQTELDTSCISFNSADPAIAVVSDQGCITGVKGGTTSVTAAIGKQKVSISVTITDAIKITVQPEDQQATDGYVYFAVKAKGDGLTYKWQVRAANGKTWNNTALKGYNTNTLRVPVNDTNNGRHYRCVITDKYGNVVNSNEATLTMINPVAIVTQPKNVTVASGEKATVTVKAEGDGLTYKWYFKDAGSSKFKLTTSFTGNTYSVTMTAARSGRQVYCVIADQYGNEVQSDTVILSMGNPLSIVSQPKSVEVPSGEKAEVTVKATGDGLTYKWYFKDAGSSAFKLTTSFTGSTYKVTMTAARDGRQVYCVIADKYGNKVQTDTVTLTMASPVTIVTQPKNVVVPGGQLAKVTVKATGDGLTYKWYYRNAGASKFTVTDSFKSNYYQVNMNATRSGRQVYCVITDKYGNSVTTDTVTLTMGNPVKIVTQPESVTAPKGILAKVTVKASGDGLTYKWYYKNAGASKFTVTDSFKSNYYQVNMNATRSGRQVYCVITDKYGNSVTTDTVTLTMGNPVTIVTQPTDMTVAKGTIAKVTVKATGDGLTYRWYYKNTGASAFTLTDTFKSTYYQVSMTAARSGRQVYCVITDKYGNSVTTNTVTLKMK